MKTYVVLFKETPILRETYIATHLVKEAEYKDQVCGDINRFVESILSDTAMNGLLLDVVRDMLVKRYKMTGLFPLESQYGNIFKIPWTLEEYLMSTVSNLYALFYDEEGRFKRIVKR